VRTHESEETYLETIFVLSKKGGIVRSIDIAHELEYSRPSVSIAMKNLREKGHILMDEHNSITLTDTGRKIAESVYEKHTLITDWLCSIGVSKTVAEDDACKMEHILSDESFRAIKKHLKG